MEQEYKYMVCTRCFTFNQAPYIVDAMNGFTMQETTFPVVTLVVDDASTDGEPEIIKQYLSDYFQTPYREEVTDDYCMICANHKSNLNCTFILFLLKYNHYSIKKTTLPYLSEWLDNSKYHALCEGDDYWVHSNKLQIQVDFLEIHPDISYTCTRYKTYIDKTGETYLNKNDKFDSPNGLYKKYYEFTLKDAFTGPWITKTATCLYPRRFYDLDFLKKFKYSRDVHLVYSLLSKGNGVCFEMVSSVYRLNENSTFGGKSYADKARQSYMVYEELYEKTHDKLILRAWRNVYCSFLLNKITPEMWPNSLFKITTALFYLPYVIIEYKFRNLFAKHR